MMACLGRRFATKVTVIPGHGIGPEISAATLKILNAAGADIIPITIELDAESGSNPPQLAAALEQSNGVLLKAPLATPSGGGHASLNVGLRTRLGLYANVRPVVGFPPYTKTLPGPVDVVIVRENEEDLYTGIEVRPTREVAAGLKLVSLPGTERIVRYAFEWARAHNRRKVTCLVKDNIMKLTDGWYRRVFNRVAKEFPELEAEVQIVDIGTARLAAAPHTYDVVVTSNLYGDIVSDVVAEVTGSVGMAGSYNIGPDAAMFEAVHGTAPDIAGHGVANPSGLLAAAVHMMVYLGKVDVAENIHNAWLRTLEDGVHTGDIYDEGGKSTELVGTQAFAKAVIARLGQKPDLLPRFRAPTGSARISVPTITRPTRVKELVGSDIYLDHQGQDPEELGKMVEAVANNTEGLGLRLKVISNRGRKAYPNAGVASLYTDHWRARFVATDAGPVEYNPISFDAIVKLQGALAAAGLDVVRAEQLYLFDEERGFSLAPGENEV